MFPTRLNQVETEIIAALDNLIQIQDSIDELTVLRDAADMKLAELLKPEGTRIPRLINHSYCGRLIAVIPASEITPYKPGNFEVIRDTGNAFTIASSQLSPSANSNRGRHE